MLLEATRIEAQHLDFSWRSASNKELCRGIVMSSFESLTSGLFEALKTQEIEEIVKFESVGQNVVK